MDRRAPHPDIHKRGLVTITLKCGDQITTRDAPLNNKATFACQAGRGCGYTLGWVRYDSHCSHVVHENPLYQEG